MRPVPPLIVHLSVQHTGTWTTNAYFWEHSEVKGFQQFNTFGRQARTIGLDGLTINESLGDCTVLHKHVDDTVPQWGKVLSHYFPVVMPVRDPLASLVTRHGRHPEKYPHGNLLAAWYSWLLIAEYAFIVPVDLNPDWEGLSRHCGLEPTAPPEIQNSSSRTTWHDAYGRGDVDFLKRELKASWRYLTRLEKKLRPKLEDLGYRDLLWWSR